MAVAILCLLGPSARATDPPPVARPNILFILIDDLGWMDLGCYGSTFYETPHIDGLAADGARFTRAYSASPVCSPTRASVMTGRNPARVGFTGHITAIERYRIPPNGRIIPPKDHMKLRLEEATLAEALKPLGYRTGHFGKWHLGGKGFWPEDQGFDVNVGGWTHGSPPSHFHPYKRPSSSWNASIPNLDSHKGKSGEYLTDRLTDEAIAFIETNCDRAWFCCLSHYAVHTPIQAKADLTARYKEKLKTDASQKNAAYAAMIDSVDQGVGKVLKALDRLKLAKNTVVVFFSDNGGLSTVTDNSPLREGKQTLYEGGIRVPLILKWPGRIPTGRTFQTAVISDDLFPTLVDMAGGNPSANGPLDGRSLKPLLTGRAAWKPRTLFWYYPHYAREPGAAVIEANNKLIEFYDPPRVELYDLASDPGEKRNLAREKPEQVARMRRLIDDWLNEVKAIRHTTNANFDPSKPRGKPR